MPRSLTRRLLRHLLLVSLASCVLAVFSRGWDEWDQRAKPEPDPVPEPQQAPAAEPARKRSPKRRFATTLSFCILFFAGLALSAGAGNSVRTLLEDGTTDSTSTATTTTDDATAAAKMTADAPSQAGTAAPALHGLRNPQAQTASARPAATRVVVSATPTARAAQQAPSAAKRTVKRATVQRSGHSHKSPAHKQAPLQPLDAESDLPGATVWLHG